MKKAGNYIKWLFKREYRIVQTRNELTDEQYYFIEKRVLYWWVIEKIKSPVYQHQFGCDSDGMFRSIDSAKYIKRFLEGDLKLVKKVMNV